MRRILLLMSVAAMMVLMAAVTAGPAFAARCPVCPVEANDQAQGSFFTGQFTANDESNDNSRTGQDIARRSNTNP